MLAFILQRLAAGLALLATVATGTFFLAHLAIGDPTDSLLGASATPEQQAALAARLGTDRPLPVQFADWVGRAVTGDLGVSWVNEQPVATQIARRVPVTASVVSAAMVLTAIFGTVIGLVAGLSPGSRFDRVLRGITVVLFALPGFWLSLVLITIFAVRLRWLPAVGYVSLSADPVGWLRSVTLPAVSLALGTTVIVAEQLRNAVIAVSQRDFVRTLRARGLPGGRVRLHILRNAAPAALTMLAVLFASLLGGAVVIELIFNLPGLGQLTLASSQNGDIPVLLGVTVVSVVLVVAVYLVLDIVLGWLNPRVRV